MTIAPPVESITGASDSGASSFTKLRVDNIIDVNGSPDGPVVGGISCRTRVIDSTCTWCTVRS